METPDQLSIHREEIILGIVPIDIDQSQIVLLGRAGKDEKSSERGTEMVGEID